MNITDNPRLTKYLQTLALVDGIQRAGIPIRATWFTAEDGRAPELSYIDLDARHLESLAAAIGVTT